MKKPSPLAIIEQRDGGPASGGGCCPHPSRQVSDWGKQNKSRDSMGIPGDIGSGRGDQQKESGHPGLPAFPLPCTQPPGMLIPDYSLKSYLYADSSPACCSSWMNPQTLASSCLVNISMWTPTTHFTFNSPQPELPEVLYPSLQNTLLSLSKLISSLLAPDVQTFEQSLCFCFFSHIL